MRLALGLALAAIIAELALAIPMLAATGEAGDTFLWAFLLTPVAGGVAFALSVTCLASGPGDRVIAVRGTVLGALAMALPWLLGLWAVFYGTFIDD